MNFTEKDGALIGRQGCELLQIEPWGSNAFRVRSTMNQKFGSGEQALCAHPAAVSSVEISSSGASITNGTLTAEINPKGVITFTRQGKVLLREFYRFYDGTISRESRCLRLVSREFKGLSGNDWKLTVRFESNDSEKLFGMGQYQQPYLDLKGCVLELAQRNSQVSIPFVISSLGYGFLWNNPAVGRASFGKNMTEWYASETEDMDYWITAQDTPAALVRSYTEVVGRAPMFSEDLLGLWQCKLRYRTPEEVLAAAEGYQKRGIPLDVIVIDYFHWPYQGDWRFDEAWWPDVKAMTGKLHAMGIKVCVSVWPSVDRRSENYGALEEAGLLMRTERGSGQTYDFQGDCRTLDAFHPEARAFLWDKCRENYVKNGIDMFWLDNSEPDPVAYDFENFRYCAGPAQRVSNLYPKKYLQAVFEGLEAEGGPRVMSLIRSAWVGSQRYGALLWSGDVPSTFEAFRDQVAAGLSAGLAGIPWWTTDIGGFMTDDCNDPDFHELLVRWYQFAVFCPILRMHGDRGPHNIPALDNRDFGGGYLTTGQNNEIFSYGEDLFRIMKHYLDLRISMKPYLVSLMQEAHETGAPLMRTMFYEFPEDPVCWELSDQYMFGSRYLAAPVMTLGARSRRVYLPQGSWKNINTGEVLEGGQTITAEAPLEEIPVFEKI